MRACGRGTTARAGAARRRAPLQLHLNRWRPLRYDLESACRGPREYDLAALILRDRWRPPDLDARAALAAYGPYDEDLLEQALPVYAAWIAASFVTAVGRRPEAATRPEPQMQFLRRYRS